MISAHPAQGLEDCLIIFGGTTSLHGPSMACVQPCRWTISQPLAGDVAISDSLMLCWWALFWHHQPLPSCLRIKLVFWAMPFLVNLHQPQRRAGRREPRLQKQKHLLQSKVWTAVSAKLSCVQCVFLTDAFLEHPKSTNLEEIFIWIKNNC